MPIFEYRCGDCGEVSEKLVAVVQETASLECDSCGPGHEPSSACEAAGCPNAS